MAGRRKQAKPQANVGRVEDREATPEEAVAKDPEFDLDEWEEANAEPSRPRKKQRRPGPRAQRRALVPPGGVFRRLETEPQQWAFAELRLRALGAAPAAAAAAAALLASEELCLAFPAAEDDAMGADVPVFADSNSFSNPLAELSLTSGEAAAALAAALPSAVALGPLAPAPDDGTTLLCPISVSVQAMERGAPGWAEDTRRGNMALLRLLRCLLPAAQAAALDPEREFEGEDDAELTSSPLCSPRSRGGGAAAGAFSPTAAGAAEAAAAASFDAAEIYAAVKPTGREPELTAPLPALLPSLRGYQRRAAAWMVARERGEFPGAAAGPGLHPLWREVRCLGPRARPFFVNAYSGLLSTEGFPAPPPPRGGIASDEMGLGKTVELLALIVGNPYTGPAPDFSGAAGPPPGRPRHERIDCVCGAANEDAAAGDAFYDGLWVQCAACEAWLHGGCVGVRRAPKGEYTCAPCLRARAAAAVAQPCGATLVVCPSPILAQWRDEIGRHVRPGTLKLFVYEGQAQPGQRGALPLVTPADLAAADIVLTTYDVLRKDLHHDADPEGEGEGRGRALRRGRRYQIIPTPLTRVKFWRVAIDEAQMVESSTAKAAAMALKLRTEHRWCVSGTPLSRGLEDLQGLLAFLQAEPYAARAWWRRAVQAPYETGSGAARRRLLRLLRPAAGGLLWRSAKADVKHELGLPPQHHHLSTLRLSAIERHFYARQHQDCVGAARTALSATTLAAAQAAAAAMLAAADHEDGGAGFEDRPLTQREEQKLLHPLLRLRQACVHPQVGAGGIRALSHSRAPMTMGEVLDTLLAKARVEAEDAQRALLAALNGLAGLFLLQGLPADAVRAYREVLATVEGNRGQVRADALQQLHAAHNLAAALAGPAAGHPGVPRTLRDGELAAAAAALREEYLAEPAARLAAAEGELAEVRAGAAAAAAEFEAVAGAAQAPALVAGWWVDAIGLLQRYAPGGGDAVAAHIKDHLLEQEGDFFRHETLRNAAALHRRFRDLPGLHLVLQERLSEVDEARRAALDELAALSAAVAAPSPQLVRLSASCVRCRGEMAVSGRVCRHCRLDEKFTGWEARAFDLVASTMAAGGEGLSVEAAAQREYAQGLRRAGRGGLGEDSGPGAAVGAGDRRAGISRTDIIHRPSQAEQALRLLAAQLRGLRVPPEAAPRRDLLAAAAAAHLAALEASRRAFTKARALALAQRQKLYALDELDMCCTRLELRAPGEAVGPAEELYKIHEAEVPVKSTELSADKAVAQAELRRTLGTLRYLAGLKAEAAARRAAGASPQKLRGGGEGGEEAKADPCPICQEPLGPELCMLPCGHRLCCRCQLALAEQLPAATPAASKRIGCPTCRSRVLLSEIAYIDAAKEEDEEEGKVEQAGGSGSGRGGGGAAEALDYSALPGERSIRVHGSYGSKLEAVVRRLAAVTRADPAARALIFSSWKDALELASHALTANSLPHLYPKAGGKKFDAALAKFRGDGGGGGGAAPRILLLLIKQGGNGLNLQQAQHVVFLEPVLDPAEEAQAVGRVDRIGQSQATHVHRFVVADSVEENVHRLGQHRAAAMDMAAAAVRRGKAGGERGALTLRDVAALLAGGRGGQVVQGDAPENGVH